MPLDGLSLSVLVNELDLTLKNSRILKIYQPDHYTITLQLRLPGETKILLISVDPQFPRIHTLDIQPTNPLNPPPFCMLLRKYLEPSRLVAIEQQGFDRILALHLETVGNQGQLEELKMIFELMGGQSNLYLVNKEGIILDAIKRFPERNIMPGAIYSPPSDQGKISPNSLSPQEFKDELRLLPPNTNLAKWLSQTFQGFSQLAAREVVHRAGFASQVTRTELSEVDWEKIEIAYTDLLNELKQGGQPAWYPQKKDFAAYALTDSYGQVFPTTDVLIANVLGTKHDENKFTQAKRALLRQLKRHNKRVQKKEQIQEKTLAEAENADIHRLQGELLTANFHLLKAGASEVEVLDYHQAEQPLVTIQLDPRLSPSANVQRIFKRYQKAKASQKYTANELRKTKAERAYLEDIYLQINQADNESILKEIEAELTKEGYLGRQGKTHKRKRQQESKGPDRYLSSDGITILVGRNNRQNDELTFRLTSANHLWLHAQKIPGSHVSILGTDPIPPETLEQAAHLAAYFSQHRNETNVAVDYTQRRHVRKPRGANPGFVHYEQAKTLFVNPTKFTWPKKLE